MSLETWLSLGSMLSMSSSLQTPVPSVAGTEVGRTREEGVSGWEGEKRPLLLLCLRGEDLGDTVHEERWGGGEVPQWPELLLLPLEVRRLEIWIVRQCLHLGMTYQENVMFTQKVVKAATVCHL